MLINLDFSNISINDALSVLKSKANYDWVESYFNFLKEYSNNDQLTVKTSGTTGKKKEIIVSKQQMHFSAEATIKYFNLAKGSKVFISLSCDFIAGKMMLVRAIRGQLNLTLAKPESDPSNSIVEEFNFSPMVPMQIENILKSKKTNNIKSLLIGGGKVNNELINKLSSFDGEAFESFAMTETLTHFAIKKLTPQKDDWFNTLPGFKIDTTSNNELIVRKNDLLSNPVITNDIIESKSDTQFRWLGRSDNLINSGGIKLIPEEIESKILQHISVPFVLCGIPDDIFGQKIVIVSETSEVLDINNINKFLPKYEKLKGSFKINSFPRTESGKIKRAEIVKLISA